MSAEVLGTVNDFVGGPSGRKLTRGQSTWQSLQICLRLRFGVLSERVTVGWWRFSELSHTALRSAKSCQRVNLESPFFVPKFLSPSPVRRDDRRK